MKFNMATQKTTFIDVPDAKRGGHKWAGGALSADGKFIYCESIHAHARRTHTCRHTLAHTQRRCSLQHPMSSTADHSLRQVPLQTLSEFSKSIWCTRTPS